MCFCRVTNRTAECFCRVSDHTPLSPAQDETPLFQAAREGSYQACKLLLDHYANRDITDHMDRLPRDVAAERLHHDIVRLLDEHVTMSPQVGGAVRAVGGGGMGDAYSVGTPRNRLCVDASHLV